MRFWHGLLIVALIIYPGCGVNPTLPDPGDSDFTFTPVKGGSAHISWGHTVEDEGNLIPTQQWENEDRRNQITSHIFSIIEDYLKNNGLEKEKDEVLNITYIRRLPVILKKHYNYDGNISPYVGNGLAIYIDRKSGITTDDGLCLVLNVGIDILPISTVHFSIIDIKYYFAPSSLNILATAIGISYNW